MDLPGNVALGHASAGADGDAAVGHAHGDSSLGCSAQINQLNLIFTLGSFALSFFSLPAGLFLDTYGASRPHIMMIYCP